MKTITSSLPVLLLGLLVLHLSLASAAPSTPLSKAQAGFQAADAQLNKSYRATCAELTKADLPKLVTLQREWIKVRDEKAEGLLSFNGIQTDSPKTCPDYWNNLTDLTKERVEFLRVYTGKAVPKGFSGSYKDFEGGTLELKQTKEGLSFSLEVVRGHAAHTGEIEGVAQLKDDKAVYKEKLDPGESGPPCEISFSFREGHLVEITSSNSDQYHGMGAYFDGLYYKTK